MLTVPCKIPRLHIQMWDKDVFKWSDCIAEAVLDLKDLFKRARHDKVMPRDFDVVIPLIDCS